MSTAVMSQPFNVSSHQAIPTASANQSSITTPAGINNWLILLLIFCRYTII